MINEIKRLENLYKALGTYEGLGISNIATLAEKNLSDNIETVNATRKYTLNVRYLKAFVNG